MPSIGRSKLVPHRFFPAIPTPRVQKKYRARSGKCLFTSSRMERGRSAEERLSLGGGSSETHLVLFSLLSSLSCLFLLRSLLYFVQQFTAQRSP